MSIDHKVLPFEAPQGHVPGHEIRSFHPVKQVVFKVFDRTANLPIEHVVHWTRWTQYDKCHWPNGAQVIAVILEDGSRLPAEMMYASHTEKSYEAAPIVCRDGFYIRGLCSHETYLEVVGVRDYLRSGTPLIDPWERDNRAFEARMKAAAPRAETEAE